MAIADNTSEQSSLFLKDNDIVTLAYESFLLQADGFVSSDVRMKEESEGDGREKLFSISRVKW